MSTGASLASAEAKPAPTCCGQSLQLQDGRRAVHVGADHQHFFVLFLDQPARQFAGAGGFTGALQAGEHDHHRPLRAQVKSRARLAHEPRQFLVHDLDERLARA